MLRKIINKLLNLLKYLATLILITIVMGAFFELFDQVFGGTREFLTNSTLLEMPLDFVLTLLVWIIFTFWYLPRRKSKPKPPEYDYFPKDKDKDKE